MDSEGFYWRGAWRPNEPVDFDEPPPPIGESRIDLHDHQVTIYKNAIAALEAGKNPLIVSPTATGKTVVQAAIARYYVARGERVLIIAHLSEILDHTQSVLARMGVLAEVEQGDRRASRRAPVVVASVQSAARGSRKIRGEPFALVIIDEAHHAPAQSYRKVIARYAKPGAPVAGFTATADRLDGQSLGEVFNDVPYEMHFPQAVDLGLISPILQRSIYVDGMDIDKIRVLSQPQVGRDLDGVELSKVVTKARVLQGVAVPILDHIDERRTMAFCVSVAHAEALAKVLNDRSPGIARHVSGETDKDERAQILADFRAGKFQVLTNCALLTEGFDDPGIECIAMARPTQSRAFYQQAVGRGTRLYPGKRNLLVLDFCGNAGRHQVITAVDLFFEPDDTEDVKRKTRREIEKDPNLEVHDALRVARALPADVVTSYQTEDVGGFVVTVVGLDRIGSARLRKCTVCGVADVTIPRRGQGAMRRDRKICERCARLPSKGYRQCARCPIRFKINGSDSTLCSWCSSRPQKAAAPAKEEPTRQGFGGYLSPQKLSSPYRAAYESVSAAAMPKGYRACTRCPAKFKQNGSKAICPRCEEVASATIARRIAVDLHAIAAGAIAADVNKRCAACDMAIGMSPYRFSFGDYVHEDGACLRILRNRRADRQPQQAHMLQQIKPVLRQSKRPLKRTSK